MNLKRFAHEFVKEGNPIPPIRAGNFLLKVIKSGLLKAGLLAGGGAAAGAAVAHSADKKHEKKTAKNFYWLGRNTGHKKVTNV